MSNTISHQQIRYLNHCASKLISAYPPLCFHGYSSSIETNNTLPDKNDYLQPIEKQGDIVTINQIHNELNEINHLTITESIPYPLDKCPDSVNKKTSAIQISSIDIDTFCGQTFDRSSSAYTSKKRSHQQQRMRDEMDQYTPTSILSRVAKKLDKNEISSKKNRDYVNKSSKYDHPSHSSDIYIKLSDCQAACRRWAVKHNTANQRDLVSPILHPSSRHHHRTKKYRQSKTKLPICYRNFPLSLNALTTASSHHQSITQTKSRKDIQKVSRKNMHLNKGVYNSFICFDTGTIHFIDGPNGPILCLDQGDSKIDEQISLYRHMSNDEYDHESNFDSDFEQSSKSVLLLREENIYHTAFKLETSLLGAVDTSTPLQIPMEAAVILGMIPACILISINHMTRLSKFQLASLSLFVLKSSATSLWQRESLFNIRLIDNTIGRIDQQHSSEDDGDSFVMVQEHDDNRASSEMWNDSELLSYKHEGDLSQTKTIEDQKEQNPKFIDDYDQSTIKKNLIETVEQNDEKNSHKLRSRPMFKTNLSIDGQKINSTINRGSIFSIEGDQISSLQTSSIAENQVTEDFKELSIHINQSDEEKPDPTKSNESFSNHSEKSLQNQLTLNEPPISVPACIHLKKSSEQTLYKNNLRTADDLVQSIQSTSKQIKDDLPISLINETISSTNAVLIQSEKYLSKTRSPTFEHPPLMSTSRSDRKTSYDNADQTDNIFQQFNERKTSRTMTISRRSVHNVNEDKDSSSFNKQKRHYPVKELSDFQANIHEYKLLSRPLINPDDNKLSVVQTKYTRRKKLRRRKQICIRPPWVSSYENPTTNNYSLHIPIKRTLLSVEPLNDACQMLELYTQFKRIQCKPYECICTPLPSCFNI